MKNPHLNIAQKSREIGGKKMKNPQRSKMYTKNVEILLVLTRYRCSHLPHLHILRRTNHPRKGAAITMTSNHQKRKQIVLFPYRILSYYLQKRHTEQQVH